MKDYFLRLGKGYQIFCQILLLLMTILVIVFVFLRYSFNITFVWAEELITMLFISTTYFGAVMGMKYNEHINIGFFHERMPPKIKKYIDILNYLIILILQVALIKISMDWIAKVGNNLTDGLRLPIRYFYYMMPFSALAIGGFCLVSIVTIFMNRNSTDLGDTDSSATSKAQGA